MITPGTGATEVTVRGCTIYGNGGNEGAGIFVESYAGSPPCTIENNIVAANNAGTTSPGYGISIDGECPPYHTLRCNDVWGHTGADYTGCPAATGTNGNFSSDPLLCAPDADNFTLDGQSPCLPGHNPYGENCDLVGAFDRGCGVTATEPTTWGLLKGRFRR